MITPATTAPRRQSSFCCIASACTCFAKLRPLAGKSAEVAKGPDYWPGVQQSHSLSAQEVRLSRLTFHDVCTLLLNRRCLDVNVPVNDASRNGCPDVSLYHCGEAMPRSVIWLQCVRSVIWPPSEAFKTPASCVQPREGDVDTSVAEKLDVGPRPGHDALRITFTPRIHTPVERTALAPVQWRNMHSFRTTDRYGSLSSLITYGNANEVPAERSLQQRHSTARPTLTLAFCCCFFAFYPSHGPGT